MAGLVRSLKAAIAASAAACLAAACGVEPQGRALIEDAGLERAEPDCARIVGAGEIAKLSGLIETGEQLYEAARQARCADSVRAEPWSVLLSDGPLDPLTRRWMQLESLWDPYTRLYLSQLEGLPPGCEPGLRLTRYPPDLLVPAYLSDPDRRVLIARRAASDTLSQCAQAMFDLAEASQALGEPDFAAFWEREAMRAPSRLAASLKLDRAEAACSANVENEACAAAVEAALTAMDMRAELFDFEMIERALTIPALFTVGPLDEYRLASSGRETLAAWALLAPRLGWDVVEPATRVGEAVHASGGPMWPFMMTKLLEALGAGLFEPSVIPGAPDAIAAASEACADRAHLLDDLNSLTLLWDASSDDLPCLQAVGRLIDPFKPSPLRGAQELVAALQQAPQHAWDSPDLLEMASRVDRDMLSGFPLREIFDLSIDEYGCTRPEPHFEPVWNAAAPTLHSDDCERLAEVRPNPADARSIAALMPFETCPDDLLDAPEGVQRRWEVAIRADQRPAYACALEMVRSAPRHPATRALYAVHAGALTGRLPQDTVGVLRRDGVRVDIDPVFTEILAAGIFPELAAEIGPQLADQRAAPAKPAREGPVTPKPAPDPAPAEPKPGPG